MRYSRPSPALVISVLALFVALGGVGYAAATINGADIKNKTIAGKKLKNKTITGAKIKGSAVTGSKVKAGSLDKSDFKEGTLLQGPAGPAGAAGQNAATNITYRTFLTNSQINGATGEAEASCNAGEKLIGGGGGWVNASDPPTQFVLDATISDSSPGTLGDNPIVEGETATAWHVSGVNTSGGNARLYALAACAAP